MIVQQAQMTDIAKAVGATPKVAARWVPVHQQQHNVAKRLITGRKSIMSEEAIAAAVTNGKQQGIRNCDVVGQQPAAGHQVPLSAELVATGWHVRPGTTQLLCCPKRHKDAIAYQQDNAQRHKQS